jgi:hypothetical protein
MHPFVIGTALGVGISIAVFAAWRAYPPQWRVTPGARIGVVSILVPMMGFACAMFGVRSGAIAGATGAALGIAVILSRAKRARAIIAALARADVPESHEAAAAELLALIGPPPRSARGYTAWSTIALFVAAAAARAGHTSLALRIAEGVDLQRLAPAPAAHRAQVLAAICIALRDRARARAELARVNRPAVPALMERALVATEALLDALEGTRDDVEPRASASLQTERDPVVRVIWLAARAHALALADRRDEAREALRELQRTAPPDQPALERVVRAGGPASPLAESLLAEVAAPYR